MPNPGADGGEFNVIMESFFKNHAYINMRTIGVWNMSNAYGSAHQEVIIFVDDVSLTVRWILKLRFIKTKRWFQFFCKTFRCQTNLRVKRSTHCTSFSMRSEFFKHCSRAEELLKIIYISNYPPPDGHENLEPLEEFLILCDLWRKNSKYNTFAKLNNNQRTSYWNDI